jgi:hypothetical protein
VKVGLREGAYPLMSFEIGIWEHRLHLQRRNHERNPIWARPMHGAGVLFRECGCGGHVEVVDSHLSWVQDQGCCNMTTLLDEISRRDY